MITREDGERFIGYVGAQLPMEWRVRSHGPRSRRSRELRLLVEQVPKRTFTWAVPTDAVETALQHNDLESLAFRVANAIRRHK